MIVDSLKPIIDLWVVMNQALGNTNLIGLSDEMEYEAEHSSTPNNAEFDLVEYEGMLVSAISAQRRRYAKSWSILVVSKLLNCACFSV